MAGQTCEYGYGKVDVPGTYASFASMKVDPPFNRISAVNSGRRTSASRATRVGQHEHNGVLLHNHVEHPNGTVILLQASWNRRGVPVRDGALFMRLRAGAPLYHVSAYLPMSEQNLCGNSFVMFSGYADIMSTDDLEILGIHAGRGYLSRFMEPEQQEECFSLMIVQPETIPRPSLSVVSTPTGKQVKEVAAPPMRRIVVRRR